MSTAKKPAAPRKAPVAKKLATKQTDLSVLLELPARIDAGFQKILDRMTQPAPVALPNVQTGVDNAAARLDALLILFSGKHAQSILQDMLDTGCPPSREQLLREADRFIAWRGDQAGVA